MMYAPADEEVAVWNECPQTMTRPVSMDMVTSRTFDNRIQLLEYVPRVLDAPPGLGGA